MLFLTILLFAIFKGKSSADVITSRKDNVFATAGDRVTLSCNFSSGYVSSLHWYRQYLGSPPQFLILDYSGSVVNANPPIQGISIKHRKEDQEVDLEIESAAVSDSALYYCALEPTVTRNTTSLYKNLTTIH
ncbi:TCR-alpha V segment II-62 [Triplophysa rosa]|nr:TCR-alpha V segment II-62 [Triplophysa rosa]